MGNSINTILFDLDDTLMDTHAVFITQINKSVEYIADITKEDRSIIKEFIDASNIESYEKFKVNPENKWEYTTNSIKNRFGLTQEQRIELYNMYLHIYSEVPNLNKGVIETLGSIKSNNIKAGLVTHASEEWTLFKLKSTGILKYFEHIEIVNTNRAKFGNDWLNALKSIKSEKENTLIVGDNLKGDIIATFDVGFRNILWMKKEGGWTVYNQGDIPKDIHIISEINEVLKYLK